MDATPLPEPKTTLTRRVQLPYLVDHTDERLARHHWRLGDAKLSRTEFYSHIPSGLICAAIMVVGAAPHVGLPGMAAIGAIGTAANGFGMRKTARRRQQELRQAESALFDPWADDIPEQGMDGILPIEYTDPKDAWRAIHAVREAFPETRDDYPGYYMAAKTHISESRAARHADYAKSRRRAGRTLQDQLETIIAKSPFGSMPVAGEIDPELQERIELFAKLISPGAVDGSLLEVRLPAVGCDGLLVQYALGETPELKEIIAYSASEALVTAAPFAYDDPLSGWDALDEVRYMRGTFSDDPENPTGPYLFTPDRSADYVFPELREKFPLPNAEERDYIEAVADALRAGEEPPAVPAGLKLVSPEAQVRANPRSPEAVEALIGSLAEALDEVLEHTTAEAFPATTPLHRELDTRLGLLIGKIGIGATEGCVFDVSLKHEDGRNWIVRYDFADGEFGVAMFPHDELLQAQADKMLADLGVPPAPGVSFPDSSTGWTVIDALSATFPRVSQAMAQLFPDAAAVRRGENAEADLRYALATAVQQVVMTSPSGENLYTIAGLVAKGAEDGSSLTIVVPDGVVRFSFAESRISRAQAFGVDGAYADLPLEAPAVVSRAAVPSL